MNERKPDFDYNLIKFLIAIVETKSMTNASELLDVAPSAVSYAVKKLRTHYQDTLFVRTINGVKPTIMALKLYQQFKEIDTLLLKNIGLDNAADAKSTKLFVRVDSVTELMIVEKVSKNTDFMKRCTLEFKTASLDTNARNDALRRYEVDVDIGMANIGDSHISSMTLLHSRYCFICAKNSNKYETTLSLSQYQNDNYVAYSSNYINTGLYTDMSALLSSKTNQPVFISDSFLCLITHALEIDTYLLIPEIYLPSLQKYFAFKRLTATFLPDHNLKLLASWNKNNTNQALIAEFITLIQQKW
ncbi:LysR family transcriptional regulator [Enterobacter quasiroggenkampii]|uniref:LysR family transcriptional regulator n=1 Tax=Enterobacter quasiroggenkampii TaxID=2497436 RepID=UPI0021CEAA70|nr:LysR family transcriptional regulator [Enterobacter quasiroggenkampii]MCU6386094.1 LysR family transcriptional regulator [Enterobacter quasiroggenkampii]MCU6395197.1 LysR family transcriptional regulator [Enterobacter quasiroggenkampii]MCU6404274.1 LysR family transcriptional regulator [Enterobacter quasiroggenkampii]MCU6417848.1 LysR family transcriptional regulator [Enterobacter quasiroggenkampii]